MPATIDDRLKAIERDLSVIAAKMNAERRFDMGKRAQAALVSTVELHHGLKLARLDHNVWKQGRA